MSRSISILPMLAVAVALVSTGCIDHACPPGQHEQWGVCYPDATDAGATDGGGVADGGVDGGGGVLTCTPTGDYTEFGKTCSQDSDCACPARTCNTYFSVCTEYNCNRTGPDGGTLQVCPPGWTCQAIPAGTPGVPPGADSICLQ